MKRLLGLILTMVFTFAMPGDILLSMQHMAPPRSGAQPGLPGQAPGSGPSVRVEYSVIGLSSQERPIYSVTFTPEGYSQTILLTFAVHGYEDSWENDGSSLVQIANEVIGSFSRSPDKLHRTRLIVVPCVNPDGIDLAQKSAAQGRQNAQGTDINRDFDYLWRYTSETKYRTGNAPFATPEARTLRDLVLKEGPDLVIDCHGWLNAVYGDHDAGQYFAQSFGGPGNSRFQTNATSNPGTFSGWAGQHTRALLVEYPDPHSAGDLNRLGYSEKTLAVLESLCSQDL